MWWDIPPIWRGETAYIIGGGPSVKLLDLTVLHKKRVLGVNNAYRLGDWIDVVFFGDCGWYGEHCVELRSFAGLKITTCSRAVHEKGIRGVNKGTTGLSRKRDTLCWGNSSGYAAINLAFLLGVKKIILLGYDMQVIDGEHNYHSDHSRKNIPDNIYETKFVKPMPELAKALKEEGVKVFNATPGSALEVFPIVNLNEVL